MGTVLICLAAVNSFLNEWYSLVRTKFSIFVKQQSDAPEKVSVTISVDVVVVMADGAAVVDVMADGWCVVKLCKNFTL